MSRSAAGTVRFNGLLFDPADGRLARIDRPIKVHLRPRVASLLGTLLDHSGEVVDRESLRRTIWGEGAVLDFESGLAALLRELRQAVTELGCDASMVETLPRRGYRLNAEIEGAEVREGMRGPSSAGSESRSGPRYVLLLLLPLLIVAALAGSWWWMGQQQDRQPPRYALAILPPELFSAEDDQDTRDARTPILLADHLLAELWRTELERLELIGRTGMHSYLGRDDVALAVATDLNADLLIEGTIDLTADPAWRVELRVLAIPGSRVIWSQSASGDGLPLQVSSIAKKTIMELQRHWPALLAGLDRQKSG